MKNIYKIKRKNKGFTLLEAMIYIIVFALITIFLLNYDKRIDDEQNNRKIARQINDITSAIDKRISIEGKDVSNWKNGTQWTTDLQFRQFLRQELVGINNDTCGTPQGWNPVVALNGLEPTSDEGKKLKELETEAKETKLVPCSMWAVYPYDVHPTAKILSDTNNEITAINLNFKFNNEADFNKNFRLFSLAFKVAKDQDSNEVLISKNFFYSNFATQSKINVSQCLALKQNCVLNLNMTLGTEDSKADKFKVDSSNNFKTNLGFANGKNFDSSSDTNNILKCNIWEEISPGKYAPNSVECGVTGGNNGYKQVNLIGANLDTELVQIKGECNIYPTDTTQAGITTECGMFKNGNIVQITTNQEKSKNLTANIIYTNIFNTNNLSVKNDATVTQDYTAKGDNATQETQGIAYPSQGTANYNMKMLDSQYLKTIAGSGIQTKNLVVNILGASSEVKLSNSLIASGSTLKSILTLMNGNTAVGNTTAATHEMEIGSTVAGQYNRQGSLTAGQLNLYNDTLPNNAGLLANNSGITTVNNNIIVKDSASINDVKSTVNTSIPASLYNPITKPEMSSTLIAGNVDATNSNITMKSGGVIQTEQLRFANSFKASNNVLTIGKSINFDGLPSYYSTSNNAMSGWGSGYYQSNAGIAARNININGALLINTSSVTTVPAFSAAVDGYVNSFVGSYTDGVTVLQDTADRKGYPWFTINKYGRLFDTPYYDVGPTSGFKVGSNGQFFFGYGGPQGQQTLDLPVKVNLTSLVYGYTAEQIIPYSLFGYTRTNINNLTLNLKDSLYLGDGAYIFSNGGLPKRMSNGQSFVPTQASLPVGYYWETTEPILLRDVHSTTTYYLNRSNLIYNFFVEINKKPTIIGQVGDRGSIGPSGPPGDKGESGSQGIPGLVGLRGGE